VGESEREGGRMTWGKSSGEKEIKGRMNQMKEKGRNRKSK